MCDGEHSSSSFCLLLSRLPSLTALSIDMHPSAQSPSSSSDGSAAADEAGGLQDWPGGFPMGLCNLTALTDLDLSLRAFVSPSLELPEVQTWLLFDVTPLAWTHRLWLAPDVFTCTAGL